jgi:hypothetical protein
MRKCRQLQIVGPGIFQWGKNLIGSARDCGSRFLGALLPGLIPLVLAACASSGGGGDGGGDGFVDTSQPLALTDANAPAVTGLVVDAALGGIRLGSIGTVVFEKAGGSQASGTDLDLIRLARRVTFSAFSVLGKTAVVPAALPTSVDCTGGGTVNANWTTDTDMELSVGDFAELIFTNCVEGDFVLDGPMTVGILSLAGNPLTDPSWTAESRLNFNDLTATVRGFPVRVIGTLDAAVDVQASGTVVTDLTTELNLGTGGTSGSILHFDDGEDFTELSAYSVHLQENNDGSFSISGQGTVESSFIGGIVTFETTQDLSGVDLDGNNPSAGRVLTVGAANSSVLLRVLNDQSVEMDVDDEGDGFDAGDTTIDRTWEEMFAEADAL